MNSRESQAQLLARKPWLLVPLLAAVFLTLSPFLFDLVSAQNKDKDNNSKDKNNDKNNGKDKDKNKDKDKDKDKNKDKDKEEEEEASVYETYQDLVLAYDAFWIIWAAAVIFSAQAGFQMWQVGLIRVKNSQNMLMTNAISVCISTLTWWMIGYGFAFGDDGQSNAFIGTDGFLLIGLDDWLDCLLGYVYNAVFAVLMGGATAERMMFETFVGLTIYTTIWVQPVAMHWVRSEIGWLYMLGSVDFSGAASVCLLGGTIAFWAALFLGPRNGRFTEDGKEVEMPGHSIALSGFGIQMIWFAWFAFVSGTTFGMTGGRSTIAGRATVNVLFGSAFCSITEMIYHKLRYREYNLVKTFNSVLMGMVIAAGLGPNVSHFDTIIVAVCGSAIYELFCNLYLKVKIDDVCEISIIFGIGSAWGLLGAGLFGHQKYIQESFPDGHDYRSDLSGLLYTGDPHLFGIQVLTVVTMIVWGTVMIVPVLAVLKLAKKLRVSATDEHKSLDALYHGGFAYTALQVKVNDFVTGRKDMFS